MKETSRQETPPTVARQESEPPQDGEIRARWAWVEASVWTPRMLKALETGMRRRKVVPAHREGVVGKESAKRTKTSPPQRRKRRNRRTKRGGSRKAE